MEYLIGMKMLSQLYFLHEMSNNNVLLLMKTINFLLQVRYYYAGTKYNLLLKENLSFKVGQVINIWFYYLASMFCNNLRKSRAVCGYVDT